MKKKLALLIAAALTIQQMAAISINAAGSPVEKVYADVYGVEIDFTSSAAATEAAGSISLEGVEATAIAEGDKVFLKPDNDLLLNTDTQYTLTIGEETKTFQIKTMFFEDFESLTYPATTDGTFPGENITEGSKDFYNKYGKYTLNAGNGGAFVRKVGTGTEEDTEVGVTDNSLKIEVDTFIDMTDATLMADIKGYGKNYNATTVMPNTQVTASLRARSAQELTDETYSNKSQLKLYQTRYEVGTINQEDSFTDPTSTIITGNYSFGKLVNAGSVIVSKDTAINTASSEREIALRTNGKSISGFVSSERTTVADPADEAKQGAFEIGYTNQNRGLAVIDNVRITKYTEDLTPRKTGTITEPTLDGNTTALILDFEEDIEGVGPVSLSKIVVKEDGIITEREITVDEEDSSKLKIVPEGLEAGHIYTVEISKDFGVEDLRVEETEGFTLQKELIPTQMTPTDQNAMNSSGIQIAFDKNIEEMTTNEAEKITVYKKASGADDSTYEQVTYTFTKQEKVLTIIPDSYEANYTYKVVIAQGYGDADIKLLSEYIYTDTVEREIIKPTKITGNEGFIEVEFSKPFADGEVSASMLASHIKILKAGEFGDESAREEASTATISNGKIKINIPGMQEEVEYELLIKNGFGTSLKGTNIDFLKRFELKELAFEDFEGETTNRSHGNIPRKSSVLADNWDTSETPNHRVYLTDKTGGGTQVFTTEEKVDAETGEIISYNTAGMENLVVEFDFQFYYKLVNNPEPSGSDPKEYDDEVIWDSIYINNQDPSNSNDSIVVSNENGAIKFVQKKNNSNVGTTQNGTNPNVRPVADAHAIDNNTVKLYKNGEAFPSDMFIYKKDLETRVYTSTRDIETAQNKKIKIVKTGKTVSIWVGTTQIINNFTADRLNATTGHIRYGCSTNISSASIDNIKVLGLVVYDDEDIVSPAIEKINLSTAAAAEDGKLMVANYTEEDVTDMAVVVAAYGADGKMLSAYYDDTVTSLAAGARGEINYSLDGLDEAVSIKAFIWDGLQTKSPIAVYDLAETE